MPVWRANRNPGGLIDLRWGILRIDARIVRGVADGSKHGGVRANGQLEPVDLIELYPRQLGMLVLAQVPRHAAPLGDEVDVVGAFAADLRLRFPHHAEEAVLHGTDP